MTEREQEMREMRRALKGKARMVETLGEDLKMSREEIVELKEEVRARRLERRGSDWEQNSQPQIDQLLELVQEQQDEIRRLESL
ncbi:hypothetical protein FRC07_008127, partial [Ceratobasidium sp. 392]